MGRYSQSWAPNGTRGRDHSAPNRSITDSPTETTEQLELQTGRRAPFSQLGDWVMLADPSMVRHPAKILYWTLAAHVSSAREDTVVWPSQDTLAEILGYSDGRKLRAYIEELEAIDAITVRKKHVMVGGLRRTRSIYVVHQTPPENYGGHESLTEFYSERRARQEAAALAETLAAALEPDTTEPEPGTPGGRNGPPGESGPEPLDQGAEMGPLVRAEMGPLVRGRNGPPNQTYQLDEEKHGGGNPPPPPNPPADLTAGGVENVVTTQPISDGDQQTAHAPKTPPRRASTTERVAGGTLRTLYEANRRAAIDCKHCDDAGLTSGGASCPHAAPRAPLAETLSGEQVTA